MGFSQEPDWTRAALDSHAQVRGRLVAIGNLGGSSSRSAAGTLLNVSARGDEVPGILRAAGKALSALAHSGVSITKFELQDMDAAAYEAFCDVA